ncbi:hypothetical protein SKAU_G00310880 [Synaphobranchus kaupii]|uniref:Uncharacterized protein n=1 Tax=Synaphobranchus kaupii TaxID=118154 RepID=A0A9Q1ERL2_SYNKA|nr:hypothetical protein SKAU_G00310880 [Synaphobranchus kaupii]
MRRVTITSAYCGRGWCHPVSGCVASPWHSQAGGFWGEVSHRGAAAIKHAALQEINKANLCGPGRPAEVRVSAALYGRVEGASRNRFLDTWESGALTRCSCAACPFYSLCQASSAALARATGAEGREGRKPRRARGSPDDHLADGRVYLPNSLSESFAAMDHGLPQISGFQH